MPRKDGIPWCLFFKLPLFAIPPALWPTTLLVRPKFLSLGLFETPRPIEPILPSPSQIPYHASLPVIATINIRQVLFNLNGSKPPSLNGIPPRVIKMCVSELIRYYAGLHFSPHPKVFPFLVEECNYFSLPKTQSPI